MQDVETFAGRREALVPAADGVALEVLGDGSKQMAVFEKAVSLVRRNRVSRPTAYHASISAVQRRGPSPAQLEFLANRALRSLVPSEKVSSVPFCPVLSLIRLFSVVYND